MNEDVAVMISKALADKTRLEVVRALREGEKCACMLLEHFSIGQSTLSHHMKVLTDSGLVKARKDGKWSHYTLCESALKEYLAYLESEL